MLANVTTIKHRPYTCTMNTADIEKKLWVKVDPDVHECWWSNIPLTVIISSVAGTFVFFQFLWTATFVNSS